MNVNGTEQTLTTLTRKQLKAIPVIISSKTITEGVRQAGISKTIFYEWIKNDTFKNEFISRQNDIIETALKELKGLASEAIEKLGTLLRESVNENIKLKAIALIIEHTIKMKEIENIEERLRELERRLNIR